MLSMLERTYLKSATGWFFCSPVILRSKCEEDCCTSDFKKFTSSVVLSDFFNDTILRVLLSLTVLVFYHCYHRRVFGHVHWDFVLQT